MAQRLAAVEGGTRFRIFPQASFAMTPSQPIEVQLSPPAGSLGIGPHDARMCVIQPLGKDWSYGELIQRGSLRQAPLPPWRGAVAPPARPGPDGGFVHLEPSDPTFDHAHAYACVRLSLDVWEGYLGRTIPWLFGGRWLEIGLLEQTYDNGEVGWGWLELGWDCSPDRPPHTFARNLDVIAHEVGHLIVYGIVGDLPPDQLSPDYLAFHESFGDMAAILVASQLPPVVSQVLEKTRGNLYVANELNRLGELSSNTQIRLACNQTKLSEFMLGWSDEHALAEPLTGALFDTLIEIYHDNLRRRGIISDQVADFIRHHAHLRSYAANIQVHFDSIFHKRSVEFLHSFNDACDTLGGLLARLLLNLSPFAVSYSTIRQVLVSISQDYSSDLPVWVNENFAWREIGEVRIGPFIPTKRNHIFGTIVPVHQCARRSADTFVLPHRRP